MHLAVATDTSYLPWCATAVLSGLQATPERPFYVHVLHGGDLTSPDRDRFGGMVRDAGGEIEFLAIEDRRVAHLPSKGALLGGRVSWLRVLLPELVPDVSRMIYLDSDTLVVSGLDQLWRTPLDAAPLAAVSNVVEPTMRPHVEGLGIRDVRQYFNAGVLLMNLDLIREERSVDEIASFVRKNGETRWYDQDALNAVFADRWIALDPRWNTQNSFWYWKELACEVFDEETVERATTAPGILHFEGPSVVKPWHFLCQHPFTRRYRDVLRSTPWRHVELEERTIATRAIRLLPAARQHPAYVNMHRRRARRSLGATP